MKVNIPYSCCDPLLLVNIFFHRLRPTRPAWSRLPPRIHKLRQGHLHEVGNDLLSSPALSKILCLDPCSSPKSWETPTTILSSPITCRDGATSCGRRVNEFDSGHIDLVLGTEGWERAGRALLRISEGKGKEGDFVTKEYIARY